MAFYLRKGINFGPLRVNLSKSGLGLSAGVKGARIGINSQGRSYVHGGRHGLYYRKNLGNIGAQANQGTSNRQTHPEEEIFTDTGLAYPALPELKRDAFVFTDIFQKNNPLLLIGGIVLLGVSLLVSNVSIKLAIAVIGLLILIFYNKQRSKRNNLMLAFDSLQHLKPLEQNQGNWEKYTESLDEKSKVNLAPLILNNWLEKQLTEGEILDLSVLLVFLPIDRKNAVDIALGQYTDAVEFVLADHQLSPAEQILISQIETSWQIPSEMINAEKELIEKFQALRQLQVQPLTRIEISRALVGSERAFFEGHGRLLNQRILDSWQANRIRYKSVGYQLDMEGLIRVTDRVLEIQEGRNTRSYPIRKIQDIYLNTDGGTVEIFVENRKNPLVMTSPHLFELAGVLQKVTTDEIGG